MAGERAALPLLAFAVSRLWEKRDRERKLLTRAAYEEIGGVAGALAQHAEATLETIGGRAPDDRPRAVPEPGDAAGDPGGGGHGGAAVRLPGSRRGGVGAATSWCTRACSLPTRPRPTSSRRRAAACGPLRSGARTAPGARPRRRRVEIVHESLLTAWPRLARWRAQDQDGAILREQLRQAARLWEEKGRPSDLLWNGTSYREYELWRSRYGGALSVPEEAFARAMRERARRRRYALSAGGDGDHRPARRRRDRDRPLPPGGRAGEGRGAGRAEARRRPRASSRWGGTGCRRTRPRPSRTRRRASRSRTRRTGGCSRCACSRRRRRRWTSSPAWPTAACRASARAAGRSRSRDTPGAVRRLVGRRPRAAAARRGGDEPARPQRRRLGLGRAGRNGVVLRLREPRAAVVGLAAAPARHDRARPERVVARRAAGRLAGRARGRLERLRAEPRRDPRRVRPLARRRARRAAADPAVGAARRCRTRGRSSCGAAARGTRQGSTWTRVASGWWPRRARTAG